MDFPGDSTSRNSLLKDLKQLEELHSQIDQLYDHYQELEHSVNKLGAVVDAHPETDYEHDSELCLYDASGKKEAEIEKDMAVLIGTTSQKWRTVNRLFTEVDRGLCKYQEKLGERESYLPEYQFAHENCREVHEELRETEREIEDMSIETYLLLEEQPSPDSKTVLRPSSPHFIASD